MDGRLEVLSTSRETPASEWSPWAAEYRDIFVVYTIKPRTAAAIREPVNRILKIIRTGLNVGTVQTDQTHCYHFT